MAGLSGKSMLDIIRAEREARAAEKSLLAFTRQAFPIIEPGNEFRSNWHLEAMCDHLEAVTSGEIKNLIINIPPGPMRWDSIVDTSRGPRLLRDIDVGDYVLTHEGRYRRVTEVHDQGVLPILKITANSGRVTHAAPTHPYLTPKGWVKASELVVGDVLAAIHPEEDRTPNGITPEIARLLGYMVGDGSLTQKTVMFTNSEQDIIDDFVHCCQVLGFDTSVTPVRNTKVVRILGGKYVTKFFEQFGIMWKNSYEKRIPEQIKNSTKEIIRNFIGAYWSCDGLIDVRATRARDSIYRSSCTTVNSELAYDILHALAYIGIRGRIRRKSRKLETVAQPGGEYVSYNVEVSAETETAKFKYLPGLCVRKKMLTEKCREDFSTTVVSDPIVSIEQVEDAECYCLTVEEDHSFTCSGIAVHNCMKSLLTSVCWPAWEWITDPTLRYMGASYGVDLAIRDAMKCRDIITSDWYQERWPHIGIRTGDDQKTKYSLVNGGWRMATSVGGRATGEHPDRKIVDDPTNAAQAASDAERETANTWFDQTLSTRGESRGARTVVVMQRLHERDLTGHILEDLTGYEHLCLPMRFDGERRVTGIGWEDPRSRPGQLLWPELFPEESVKKLEQLLGEYGTAGQLAQQPSPVGGGILKVSHFQLWPADRDLPSFDYVVQSVDPAYTAKTTNDPTAFQTWGVFTHDNRRGAMLLDCWADHLAFPELRAKLIEEWSSVYGRTSSRKGRRADALLIEAKASGLSLIQDLRQANLPATPYNPGNADKINRAHQIAPILELDCLWIPESHKDKGKPVTWARSFISEVEKFPNAAHDDQVDVLTQCIIYLRDSGWFELDYAEPDEPEEYEEQIRKQKRVNPYAV